MQSEITFTTCPLLLSVPKILVARLPARETKHYSASIAENISVLTEAPPPKISRFKPCLLAKYAADHLNTSLLGSSSNALVDIFLAIFCTVVQIRLRIRHMAPKIAPDTLRNMVSARPEQTCISYRKMRLHCLLSCFLYIFNMPNKL